MLHMYVEVIYSQMQRSLEYHKASIKLKIDLLPCKYTPSETDIKEVLVHLFSWVSNLQTSMCSFLLYKQSMCVKQFTLKQKADWKLGKLLPRCK